MNIAQALGFPRDTKLLMIHADDAGLCHSENRATFRSLQEGIVNSYSIMVPCPWFYEAAQFAKTHPEFDMGIHLTLTCEWQQYRFGPVLSASEVPSLVDNDGYFFKKREALRDSATPTDVKKELTTQIERALHFGLKPTHLDCHMYSVGSRPEFFQVYKELGETFSLPVLVNRQLMEFVGLNFTENIHTNDLIVDKVHLGNFQDFEKGQLDVYYHSVFDNLVEGINMILLHTAFDDDEMKGIAVDHPNFGSEWRQIDFDVFTSDHIKSLLEKSGAQLITWKDLGSLQSTKL